MKSNIVEVLQELENYFKRTPDKQRCLATLLQQEYPKEVVIETDLFERPTDDDSNKPTFYYGAIQTTEAYGQTLLILSYAGFKHALSLHSHRIKSIQEPKLRRKLFRPNNFYDFKIHAHGRLISEVQMLDYNPSHACINYQRSSYAERLRRAHQAPLIMSLEYAIDRRTVKPGMILSSQEFVSLPSRKHVRIENIHFGKVLPFRKRA